MAIIESALYPLLNGKKSATYLSGREIKKRENRDVLMFPFGFNLCQKQAVKITNYIII